MKSVGTVKISISSAREIATKVKAFRKLMNIPESEAIEVRLDGYQYESKAKVFSNPTFNSRISEDGKSIWLNSSKPVKLSINPDKENEITLTTRFYD